MKVKVLANVLNLLQKIHPTPSFPPILTIIEKIPQQPFGNTLFVIKKSQEDQLIKKTAQELIDDDVLINQLSPRDVKEITISALRTHYQPLYDVLDHTYYPDINTEILKIRNNKTGEVEHKLIDEAIYDAGIYLNTSAANTYRFGYIAGMKYRDK